MPGYVIKVYADTVLTKSDLDRLEDVVYDEMVDRLEASADFGATDVAASYE